MLAHQYALARKPVRAVVLGAKGFLSPAIVRALEEADVVCRPVGSKEVDLTNPGAAERLAEILVQADTLVMAAALTPDKGRDVATLMKNLRMAEQVGDALQRTRCAHVLYISSDAVYDGRSSLINEHSSCEPSDLYALMHIARERMLASACRAAGIPFVAVRPCAVYGPGDTHNSYGPNRFIRTAQTEGVIRLFGEGEERRDHIYIRDVAEIIKLCVLHQTTGVLNAVSGKASSFLAVAQQIIAAVRREVRLEFQPRGGPITHRHFDAATLVRAFSWFQPTPLETGIAQSVAGISVAS